MWLRQVNESDCGAVSILYMVKYYGGNVSLERLRQMTYTGSDGTNMLLMKRALIRLGFSVQGMSGSVDELKTTKKPCIAKVIINQRHHFVVIISVKNNRVYFFDPADGNQKMDIVNFNRIFSGFILTAKPITKMVIEKTDNQLTLYLKNYFKRSKFNILFIILCLLLLNFSVLTETYIFKNLIDHMSYYSYKIFLYYLLGWFSLNLFKIIITKVSQVSLLNFINNLMLSLTDKTTAAINRQNPDYFNIRSILEIMAKINDVSVLKENIPILLINILAIIFYLVIGSIVLIFINIKIFLLVVLTAVIIGIVIKMYSSKIKNIIRLVKESFAYHQYQLNILITSCIDNFYLSNNNYYQQFMKGCKNYYNYLKKYEVMLVNEELIKRFVLVTMNTILFIILFLMFKQGHMTLGELIQINILCIYIFDAILKIGLLESSIHEISIVYLRLKDLYQRCDIKPAFNHQVSSIAFKNISYTMDGDNFVLDNINLTINEHDRIFIYGKSGVGKSSLFKLIFSNIDSGEIILNDKYLSNAYDLRNKIIYLGQNIELLEPMIEQLFNNHSDKLNPVLDICNLWDLFNRRGNANFKNVSGGEKQKLILAMYLINNFDVLIIDEALSEVDHLTESIILNNIIKAFPHKIFVYISHHSQNKQLFNRILKLERSGFVDFKR